MHLKVVKIIKPGLRRQIDELVTKQIKCPGCYDREFYSYTNGTFDASKTAIRNQFQIECKRCLCVFTVEVDDV